MERKKPARRGTKITTTSIGEISKETSVAQTEGLLILHLDVDQGECTVFMLMKGSVVEWCCVIDGGFSDKGRGALARYLGAFKVKRVDALACTHFDGDHTKGLTSFLNSHTEFEVSELWVRNKDPGEKKSNTKLDLLKAAGKRDQKVNVVKVEAKGSWAPNKYLSIKCIHADDGQLQDENDGSLAFVFQYADFRYYTAGDLPSEREKKLLKEIGKLHAFKCGHHGSANSTPQELLDEAQPMLAFISCGHQSFGHPTYDVIERLAGCSSLHGFYMTNCIHNRKIVNPKYEKTEAAIAEALIGMLKGARENEKWEEIFDKEKNRYDAGAIGRLMEKYESKPNNDDIRLAKRLLKAAERAQKHQSVSLADNEIRAIVAGSATMLGTTALYVPLHEKGNHPVLCVGFAAMDKLDEKKCVFKWHAYQRDSGNPVVRDLGLESIGDIIAQAVFTIKTSEEWEERPVITPVPVRKRVIRRKKNEQKKEEQEKETTSTPISKKLGSGKLREVLTSPMGFGKSLEQRATKYHRFDMPTVVGLRSREDKGQYVPFCLICKQDRYEADGNNLVPVFEIKCASCQDKELYVHRKCFNEDQGEELYTDGEDVAVMDQCPCCRKADDYAEFHEEDDDSDFEL